MENYAHTPTQAKLLFDGSPAVFTVHGETNTASAVSVLNNLLNRTSNTRLLSGELRTDSDVFHFASLLLWVASQPPLFC